HRALRARRPAPDHRPGPAAGPLGVPGGGGLPDRDGGAAGGAGLARGHPGRAHPVAAVVVTGPSRVARTAIPPGPGTRSTANEPWARTTRRAVVVPEPVLTWSDPTSTRAPGPTRWRAPGSRCTVAPPVVTTAAPRPAVKSALSWGRARPD